MVRPLVFVLLFATLFALGACAPRTHPLLEHEPARMSDSGLLRYRYDLQNTISQCSQDSSVGVSVGLGVGNYGGGSYVGVGAGRSTPRRQYCPQNALQERLRKVDDELLRRGIRP